MTTFRNRRTSTLMSLVPLNMGSNLLLVVTLSVRLFGCLSVHLPVCPSYIHLSSYFSCPLHIFFTSESFFQLSDTKMICKIYRLHQFCQRTSWPYFKVYGMVRRRAEKKNYNSTFTSDVVVPICSLHIERLNLILISVMKCRIFCESLTEC